MAPQITILMKEEKRCSCGFIHTHVPTRHKYADDHAAYYWNCVCGSTLTYMPDRDKTREMIQAIFNRNSIHLVRTEKQHDRTETN